jgi:hypothetical protein
VQRSRQPVGVIEPDDARRQPEPIAEACQRVLVAVRQNDIALSCRR